MSVCCMLGQLISYLQAADAGSYAHTCFLRKMRLAMHPWAPQMAALPHNSVAIDRDLKG